MGGGNTGNSNFVWNTVTSTLGNGNTGDTNFAAATLAVVSVSQQGLSYRVWEQRQQQISGSLR